MELISSWQLVIILPEQPWWCLRLPCLQLRTPCRWQRHSRPSSTSRPFSWWGEAHLVCFLCSVIVNVFLLGLQAQQMTLQAMSLSQQQTQEQQKKMEQGRKQEERLQRGRSNRQSRERSPSPQTPSPPPAQPKTSQPKRTSSYRQPEPEVTFPLFYLPTCWCYYTFTSNNHALSINLKLWLLHPKLWHHFTHSQREKWTYQIQMTSSRSETRGSTFRK